MAVGISKLFGIAIPYNFNSPYKSESIIDFWRRWHISLSSFLKCYLYYPLGGNKKRHYGNLVIVMFLGGIWHGANFTFWVWGLYHGILLVINHWVKRHFNIFIPSCIKILLTFTCVMIGWIIFRSHNMSQVIDILEQIFLLKSGHLKFYTYQYQYISLLLAIVFAFSIKEPQCLYENLVKEQFRYKKIVSLIGALLGACLSLDLIMMNHTQKFLYSGF